ncbi:acyltransferase family protein [Massilia aurea]|uniref:acyltransferase family protein n=1 Tax=Massilia aurea TaxID=373040 RepID=UPI0034633F87
MNDKSARELSNSSHQEVATHVTPPDTSPVKARLTTIDIAKGIGILLIVLGHDAGFDRNFPQFSDFLGGIRMPFFFFISGVTFSLGRRSLTDIAIMRADAWLKPFVVVVTLFGCLNILRGTGTLEGLLLALAYGTGFTLSPRAVWFLPHLWLLYVSCSALFMYGNYLFSTGIRRVASLVLLLVLGYAFLGVFNNPYEDTACFKMTEFSTALFNCGLPMSADFLLITSVFFILGVFMSATVKSFKFSLLHLGVALGAVIVVWFSFNDSMNLNHRRYDDLLGTTALAFSGIYLMLGLSGLLGKMAWAERGLIFIGRGSLFILLFHMPILYNFPAILARIPPLKSAVEATALLCAVVVPLVIWQVCKRFKITRALFFPVYKRGQPAAHAS